MWLLLLGCAGPDTGAPADEGPPSWEGWDIGERLVCDAPQATASWTEVALPAWSNPVPEDVHGPEPGVVAWLEAPDGLWVGSAADPDGVRFVHVDSGEERTVPTMGMAEALSSADFNGDGRLDFLASGPDVSVWLAFGDEDERFRRVRQPTRSGAGVHDAVPVDVDGDGDLDIVAVHNGETEDLSWAVLRNGGRGVFQEETIEADPAFWGYGFDAAAWDVDADGDPDLLACNDKGHDRAPNGLLLNDGTGVFAPAEDALGLDVTASCMGIAFGDTNQDGRLDVYVADAFANILLERAEDGGFYDTAAARGLPRFVLGTMAWGNAVVDLDNDGRTDLLSNLSDSHVPEPVQNPAAVYMQQADGTFTESAPFVQEGTGRGVAVADYDGDGVVDVLLGQATGSPRLFRSTGCTARHWLEVEAPPGTEIVVEAGGVARAALASTEHAMGSTGPSRVHIGLGDVDTVDRVTARLPWTVEPVVLAGPLEADRRVRYVGD